MNRLSGKVALVTGASRGIGRAIAMLLATEGAKVAVMSRTANAVENVVRDIQLAGGSAIAVVGDISSEEQINAAVDQTTAAFGGIDILINNAFDPTIPLASRDAQFLTGYSLTPDGGAMIDSAR
ncbi:MULTISPECIES: SDR family NAD(P)-dependent oxidoreductase [unclassified Serratia (in: enterobacteria)]|uniref:SDR family NAD(P)-dependent oxidoreductase n=1 Tax=unclassified Serratia (in: enterobacteria) TaxID=2647522 RepID=UPI002ED25918|nr:SDR family NAD(P)-dependent oxidoreductase [Serratia sp. C2(2)]MEE4446546.1 SDR family NAD(P)-dependent oxidoreductase [Serratia sp. C2(1)]